LDLGKYKEIELCLSLSKYDYFYQNIKK